MKVALISEWLDAWRGGAETSTLQFLHRLMEADVELHVFTRSRPASTPGMSVHTIGGASMSRTRRSVTFAHRVESMLRSGRFDVVHAITPCRRVDIYQPRGGTVAESIQRNLALRPPGLIRTARRYANALNLKQRYMLAVERALLARPTGPVTVAISDYVVRQLKAHYSLPDSRIRKIYNGVDDPGMSENERAIQREKIRGEFGIAPSECLVLVIAHNYRLKGVQRWMQALALLRSRGVNDLRTLVIGKGNAPYWHRLAATLGISDILTFLGPSDRVWRIYQAGDILVHPTYYDPCSRVVLEAMTAGLPCVTTRWDGAAEMIRDGINGFVLEDPDDVDGLAERVAGLRDDGLRQSIGAAARGISDSVSMARHASDMLALYEEIGKRRSSPT